MTGSGDKMQRSQQGSAEYFVEIAQRMSKKDGLDPDLRLAFKEVDATMKDQGKTEALKIARVRFDYLLIRQSYKTEGTLADPRMSKFQLKR